MFNNSKDEKLILVCVPDEDVLTLLRDFVEPLGYQVEFAPKLMRKKRESVIAVIKGAAWALSFMVLDKIEAGAEICFQLRPT